MSGRYIKQQPYVGDDGIYMPVHEYVPEGTASMYTCVMTKEMFVEAYNKWIKGEPDVCTNPFVGQDDVDCWCD
jgi:hypothetical protein